MARTKIEARCVIDKLKVCYKQPVELFDWLIKQGGIYSDTKDAYIDCGDFTLKLINKEGKDENYTQLDFDVIIPANNYSKLGTFTFNNSSKYEGLCFFEFENSALYSIFSKGYDLTNNNYQGLLFYVAQTLGLEFNNITQVDVAIDTTKNYIKHLRNYIHRYNEYDMFLNGHIVKDPNATLEHYGEYYSRSRETMSRQPTLYFGQSKDVGLKMRIYNKTKELEEQSTDKAKRYADYVEFTTSNPIYRVEVVIKNTDVKLFHSLWMERYGDEDKENILSLLMLEQFNAQLWKWATNRLVYFKDKQSKEYIYLADIL